MWFSTKNNLIVLPNECKKLIFLNSLFQGGRLFVGAICVLYFLSFDLQTEDYAWIKTIQAIIFIGLDIPLGYLLSRIGEYKSLLLSLVFGIIGTIGYLISTSFFGFLASETFLALSISIWPVALSAFSMRILKKYKTDGLVEKFFHSGDAVSNLFVLVCGSLGGLFYAYNKYIPYSFFLIFYLVAAIFTFLFIKDLEVIKTEKKEKSNFISNIQEMKSVFPYALILFLAQFFMQPLFHYWQPLFGEKFVVSSNDLSLVFIGYSLSMSVISWGYSQLTHYTILRSNLFVVSSALCAGLIYSIITKTNSFIYSLIFLALTFGIFNLVQIASGVLIQNKLNQYNRMIVVKYISFCSRIGMIISLSFLHWLFANDWGTSEIYAFYGKLAVLVFLVYLIWIIIPKSEIEYVPEYTS
ncbi:MAG: MFS transporter [Parachlamydiaceae bacterium]|nr:MFS transporter [Parachlamydiaceae bacterium]